MSTRTSPNPYYLRIRAEMVRKGTSLTQWSVTHRYDPTHVRYAIIRWAGSKELPNGRKTFNMLRDLSKTLGYEVTPGILEAA